jgi:hypothetical protein
MGAATLVSTVIFVIVCVLVGRIEQVFDVAAQMIGWLRRSSLLDQYERTLEDRLCRARLFCSPIRANDVLPHRLGDVSLYLLGMRADAGFASRSNCRARRERFLHHRADKARELGNAAFARPPRHHRQVIRALKVVKEGAFGDIAGRAPSSTVVPA